MAKTRSLALDTILSQFYPPTILMIYYSKYPL